VTDLTEQRIFEKLIVAQLIKISSLSWKPKYYLPVHKSPPLLPIPPHFVFVVHLLYYRTVMVCMYKCLNGCRSPQRVVSEEARSTRAADATDLSPQRVISEEARSTRAADATDRCSSNIFMNCELKKVVTSIYVFAFITTLFCVQEVSKCLIKSYTCVPNSNRAAGDK
jgi:hypothetical protein